MLEYNLLGYVVEEVLLQYNNKKVLRSCAYFLKKNNAYKSNYKIYNKKLLVVIRYLKK